MTRRAFKWILWFFAGAGLVVAIFRFVHGLGSTTALDDATPWGLWIGFDVMGGVALAAGGFVMAATVYVFKLEEYRRYVKPAVLTAFLGYGAAVVGLLFDLGVPYNIWRPIINWNPRSALFEVAWCVILYFTVLALEFAPVVLEKTKFKRILNMLRKATIVLVILGIMLSTLHQSSLGTLMVLMPSRVHPLWYSPILPVLFFISAIALGLTMVMIESLVTGKLYGHKPHLKTLSNLGRAASVVLTIYLALRLIDLGARGQISQIWAWSWESFLFLIEITFIAILPIIVFVIPRTRNSVAGLAFAASFVVTGVVLNRITASGVATMRATGSRYFPSFAEVLVSVGIVSATILVFFFFVEHFKVYEKEEGGHKKDEPVFDGKAMGFKWEPGLAQSVRTYSLPFVLAAALTFALLPNDAVFGSTPETTPVFGSRGGDTLIIDGDRQGLLSSFQHAEHVERQGGENSCSTCHHMNNPLDQATPCSECHRDMYLDTNIFDHTQHVEDMGGNEACSRCHSSPSGHTDGDQVECESCHEGMRVPDDQTRVVVSAQTQENMAVGYQDAMHGLCNDCHEDQAAELNKPEMTECAFCHTEADSQIREALTKMGSRRGLRQAD